jgi:DNA primase
MPLISKEFIERLLDDTLIEEVIKDFVDLKKEGANLKGKSPFTEENTPSFIVSPAKQIWKCFSSGKGGNNAVSFLMEKGLSFTEAIEYIAKKQGKDVAYDDTKESKAYQETIQKQAALRPILKAAIKKYQEAFAQLPKDHAAKKEVARRGYSQDVIDTYQIGFAPGNKFIYNLLKEKGLVTEGHKISLLNASADNDFYYNRVTYTIFDKNGEPIGLSGRDLNVPTKVKWINPKDTDLYKKDTTWYGLHIAKQAMRQSSKVYIVEGYNDVIAFQTHGLLNTIAACGTNISDGQINVLKKYADIVYFAMDGDAAGQKSVLKNIPRFIEAGFRCYALTLKDADPDDFVRLHADAIAKEGIETVLEKETQTDEGFKILLNQLKDQDDVEKSVLSKELCELISKITDDSIVEIYTGWLQKESTITKTKIKEWIASYKDSRDEAIKEAYLKNNEYDFPKGVEPNEYIIKDIKMYQMFMANNQIYSQATYEPPYKFRSCSNFSVFIIQHMRDENFPKKLVSAENQVKESFVFDVPSDTFNMVGTFQKAMTNFGNFRWHGRADDLQRLQALLFDKMGNGRSIDALGWQPEGFFLFNNLVVVPGDKTIDIDKNGCFKFKGIAYYVPSANVIYRDNHYKYMPQKRFRHIPGTITSLEFFEKMHRVHGNHAISSIFHAIACMFHDVVVKQLKGFPINFSYGPPGTGKDELNYAVKSLWGIPQEATNLEGGNSTATANIRELAQFNNGLMEWSEYARGDSKLDGTIKSIWDLRGKKIGTLDSRVATDNIPVLSGIALTGNEYPDNPAIITRIIWNDMNKTVFSEEDEKEFNEFNDLIDEGITHITVKILNQRPLVEKTFSSQYRLLMDVYQRRIPDSNKRMLKNISTLTAFYNILKDEIDFPFTQTQILDHFTSITENQMRKLTSSSIVTRWWDCFIASMRGTLSDQILVGRDLKLEGPHLYFQFTNCYSKVQRQWFTQYRDAAPNKSTMKESIEKDSCYAGYKNVVDFNTGAPRVQSSAMYIDVMKLPGDLPDLIKAEVSRQEYELNKNPFSPAPPNSSNNKSESEKEDELPF